jgi:hypothetical protein
MPFFVADWDAIYIVIFVLNPTKYITIPATIAPTAPNASEIICK